MGRNKLPMEVDQARGTLQPVQGKNTIEVWLGNPNNISNHGINVRLALQNTKLADQVLPFFRLPEFDGRACRLRMFYRDLSPNHSH